jgi:hypothetical protein
VTEGVSLAMAGSPQDHPRPEASPSFCCRLVYRRQTGFGEKLPEGWDRVEIGEGRILAAEQHPVSLPESLATIKGQACVNRR